ncbi:MAG TPA: type 1 glutamine amidotransferase domain-containing protein [Parvibaculum sp.]
MATILMPIPASDFDPTETGVPWRILEAVGHDVVVATPDGKPANADPIMLTGRGLGLLAPVLRANADGRRAYETLAASAAFKAPIRWKDARAGDFDALLLPGGHAKGMRPYLESAKLQSIVADVFAAGKPVGAICHGTLLAARSKAANGKSVLHGRKTTGLTRAQEMLAWRLTFAWMGDYYRTYPTPLETEVRSLLASPADFETGPASISRDSFEHTERGFTLCDGNYLSARWPGDAHRFGVEFAAQVAAAQSAHMDPATKH